MDNFTFNGLDIPMMEYAVNTKQIERYILKFHVGYKTKVNRRYEDITYIDGYGQFIKL